MCSLLGDLRVDGRPEDLGKDGTPAIADSQMEEARGPADEGPHGKASKEKRGSPMSSQLSMHPRTQASVQPCHWCCSGHELLCVGSLLLRGEVCLWDIFPRPEFSISC